MGGFREFTKVEILAVMEQHTKQASAIGRDSIVAQDGCR